MRSQHQESPYADAPSHAAPSHKPKARHAAEAPAERPSRRRSSRRGRGTGHQPSQLTSHPTGRAAYADTRKWLLAEHGPLCAYCGGRFDARKMTLDHVQPRKGLTAYDRRDNLVLACPACNGAKRDMAPLSFLLANRSRAVHLLRYGTHLSPMLVDLARSLVPEGTDVDAVERGLDLHRFDDDEESPYKD